MTRLTLDRARSAPLPKKPKNQAFRRCTAIKGFCVRVTATGDRSYCVEVKVDGKPVRRVLGKVDVLQFETNDPDNPGALELAVAAINAGKRGRDMTDVIAQKKAPAGMTLNEVWAKYGEAGYPKLGKKMGGNKRPSTIKADTDRWNKHVAPTLGTQAVSLIDTPRLTRFIDTIAARGQKSHVLTLVKSILNFAESRGFAKANPIKLVPEKSREQQSFYKDHERDKLDEAARELADEMPHRLHVFTAIRIILRTGARSGEIFSARRDKLNEDDSLLRITQDKASDTGRDIYLSADEVALIKAVLETHSSPWIFPGDSKSGHLTTIQKSWTEVVKKASLPRYRPHDMRHSYISSGIKKGQPLFVLGVMAGHKDPSTTKRYAHIENEVYKAAHAATAIGNNAAAPKRLRAA